MLFRSGGEKVEALPLEDLEGRAHFLETLLHMEDSTWMASTCFYWEDIVGEDDVVGFCQNRCKVEIEACSELGESVYYTLSIRNLKRGLAAFRAEKDTPLTALTPEEVNWITERALYRNLCRYEEALFKQES